MTKKKVSFMAKKRTTKPTVIKFDTKQGQVSFTAKIKVTKPTRITFTTKKKK